MRGHIRPRGQGSWELKYDLGTDPLTGKRRTRFKTVHGTKRDAQTELTRLLNDKNQGTYIEPSKLTLSKFLEQWLEDYAKPHTAPTTYERWEEIVNKHLSPALGVIPLKDLSPLHIQGYYADALANGRRNGKGGLSAQTVKHHHRLLYQALKQAVSWRILAQNPAAAVNSPKPEAKEIQFLSKAELATLIKAAKGTRLYAPVMTAATTGLRRGELLALRWQDIDLDRGILTVNQSLEQTKAGLRFKPPKTKKGRRSITLPGITLETLRDHKAAQLRERMAMGLGRDADDMVFARHDGSWINPRNFSKEFSRLVKRSEVNPVSLHGLRHTHISHLLMDGVHVKVVSERAGHAAVSVTLDRYSHVIPNMQEDAAIIVDEGLREALKP